MMSGFALRSDFTCWVSPSMTEFMIPRLGSEKEQASHVSFIREVCRWHFAQVRRFSMGRMMGGAWCSDGGCLSFIDEECVCGFWACFWGVRGVCWDLGIILVGLSVVRKRPMPMLTKASSKETIPRIMAFDSTSKKWSMVLFSEVLQLI